MKLPSGIEILKAQIDILTKDNEALKAEVERQSNVICENVCGDCLEYEDDGTPQTGYGWNENRVEGQYACGCIQESGPYQVIETDRDRLLDGILKLEVDIVSGKGCMCEMSDDACSDIIDRTTALLNHKEG